MADQLIPIESKTTPKPGYLTTEFWLKLAAILLTALFASGVIPVGGTAERIAAIVATMLGALGYTVSRSMVKTAGAVLLFAAAASSNACTPAQRTAAPHALIDCTSANASAIAHTLEDMRKPKSDGGCFENGATDWQCVTLRAVSDGVVVGGCAYAEIA